MKLIKILALAIAMTTVATAQNPSANSQAKASPTPTPAVAGKTGGTAPAATKKAAAQPGTKASAGTPAKATADKTAAKGTSTSTKPAVKAATVPVKAHAPAGTQPKGVPTPVVAAKGTAGAVDTKKTEAKKVETKKADTKKGSATKAPAVIAVKPAQGTKKTAAATAKKPAAKAPEAKVTQLGPSTQPAEKPKPATRTFGARGRRDPFVSPIVAKDGGINRPPSNCTSGKRCLVIPELVLQGTVKDTSGKMMAVVANSIKKTYFLRENDQVFQGSVEKITSDSIIFREYVKDALGRETASEVVNKLVPTS